MEGDRELESREVEQLMIPANLDELATTTYRFIVLRCPWARIASLFQNKFVADRNNRYFKGLIYNQDVNTSGRVVAKIRRRLRNQIFKSGGLTEDFTFRQFCALLSVPNAFALDHHWRPQADFDLSRLGFEYNDVFGLHDLTRACETLEAKTGITVQDMRETSRHTTFGYKKLKEGCFADTPLSELAKLRKAGSVVDHKAMYDDALIGDVAELYSQDFVLYKKHLGSDGLSF